MRAYNVDEIDTITLVCIKVDHEMLVKLTQDASDTIIFIENYFLFEIYHINNQKTCFSDYVIHSF